MPPKRNNKRKKTTETSSTNDTNGEAPLHSPDRTTWAGWVEMESEPAFFNVMLKEMGVRGVKVQEVYGLDEEMLAILPQPVHALIFLFRYRDADEAKQEKGTKCPNHVWFANQIPDFACASVALLNIVNNVERLQMGKELRDFKDFTSDMNPLSRGDAIDDFTFVKRIHNSFARENDLLNADMHMKKKANQAKKKQALAKARETRAAKKTSKTPLKAESANAKATPTRASARKGVATKVTNKSTSRKDSKTESPASSPLSDPPDSDEDFSTPSKPKANTSAKVQPRRSGRQPQPRRSAFAASAAATAEVDDEEGFHFIAYVPIKGHVWKLDGLDSYPHDMGAIDSAADNPGGAGADWMNIAKAELETRMAMYEGHNIEFNLMAVVHDPVVKDRAELVKNVKELQGVEKKLASSFGDRRSLNGAETKKEVITASSVNFDISQADVDAAELDDEKTAKTEREEELIKLVEMRKEIMCRQAGLRAAVRDAMESAKDDEEKARHRRHDYGSFVRGWLGALAEQEVLSGLLEES